MQSKCSSPDGLDKLQSNQKQPRTWRARLSSAWSATGINVPVFLNMVKFAIGPTISIAMFQSDAVSRHFGTTGYLIAISCILSNVLAPRAAFIEGMMVNVVSLCITAAATTLAIWSAFKARQHTTPPGESLSGYNSSASAVCGVWLFFLVYVINALKSARPQYKFAGVLATIYAVVGLLYGAQFTELSGGNNSAFGFVQRFLETLLTGMGIGTAVSLLFFPSNCRTPVFNGLKGYFRGIEKVVNAQKEFFVSLETQSPFEERAEAENLRKESRALRTINTKLASDIRASKKEIAYGTLEADDFAEIVRLGREIILPLVGTASVVDIFDRLGRNAGWGKTNIEPTAITFPDAPLLDRDRIEHEYRVIMHNIRQPVEQISTAICEAVQHVLLQLGLEKKQTCRQEGPTADIEKDADHRSPGTPGFVEYLEEQVQEFRESRKRTLHQFCELHGIPMVDSFETDWEWPLNPDVATTHTQRQLFVLLHIEHLLWSGSHSFVELVRFCDSITCKKHFIYPSWSRIKKWLFSIGRVADPGDDEEGLADLSDVLYGEAFKHQKDPERLPAKTSWQKVGASFRRVPTLLRCSHSVFGFRIACAIMSIAIVGFLKDTHDFFIRQRLFWAAILATVSMTRTAGLATWIYFLRFGGTVLAAVSAYVIWYIVVGKTAGVIIFLFIFVTAFGWITVVHPRFLLLGMIAAVTTVICIGYELQVVELGFEIATSNGQDYYPIYLLAPIRLATVAAGLLDAYLWTVFPFPVTERSELRKDVGTSLILAAHHYAVIQESINARARGDDGDMTSKSSPARRLQKERMRILGKIIVLIERMRAESAMIRWQFPIDGYFPKETYDRIIVLVDKIVMYAALMGHASISFSSDESHCSSNNDWFSAFRHLLADPHLQIPAYSVSHTLFLLSHSMLNAQPLPPHPPLPKEYDLLRHLQELDPHILAMKHVAEKSYSGFAVMQIASRSLIADLHALTSLIRGLVGELDFSYKYKTKEVKGA